MEVVTQLPVLSVCVYEPTDYGSEFWYPRSLVKVVSTNLEEEIANLISEP